MNEIQDAIGGLYEGVAYLCEIRGELDAESNRRTEAKIRELMAEIQALEALV